ncbi:MAG: hypothetical protein ACI9U0_001957 [Flavobacteriales bacterium]
MLNFKGLNGIDIYEHFKEKNLEELSIEELAYTHLYYHTSTPLKNCNITSCLSELRETLSASFINRRTNQYVPLMVSFAILDQIGCLYHVRNQSPSYANGIKRALTSFSNFPSSDLEALVTLRHGLFHDGSLLSINNNTGTSVYFRMVKDSGQVITQPQNTWDGIYHDKLSDYVTRVDLKELQQLVLSVIDKCREHLLNDELAISITDPKEFYYKFLFA